MTCDFFFHALRLAEQQRLCMGLVNWIDLIEAAGPIGNISMLRRAKQSTEKTDRTWAKKPGGC